MEENKRQLWMGSIQSCMDENFIKNAFRKMGENPEAVELKKNNKSSTAPGYCFVSFKSEDIAINVKQKLNGKPIPGTHPVIFFKLNSANKSNKQIGAEMVRKTIDSMIKEFEQRKAKKESDHDLHSGLHSKLN